MLEDKLRATDWEATNEAIEEQVARASYLQWLRDTEKRNNALARVINLFYLLLHQTLASVCKITFNTHDKVSESIHNHHNQSIHELCWASYLYLCRVLHV